MDSRIEDIIAREILDSRGNPTVEVEVFLADGSRARAAVPSGASTGSKEAVELRDGDAHRYGGKGVEKVIRNIEEIIAPDLQDLDVREQKAIDDTLIGLDGTDNKSRLGANALLGVSMACARAAANYSDLPLYAYLGGPGATRLPVPCFNVLNGGVHAHWQGADFQECMLVPYGANTFREALRWGAEIYHALQAIGEEHDRAAETQKLPGHRRHPHRPGRHREQKSARRQCPARRFHGLCPCCRDSQCS